MPMMLGRRTVLRGFAGVGLGTAALATGAVGIAAAIGAARPELPDLPELPLDRSLPGIARGTLTAAPVAGGPAANQLGYAGTYPGPLIRLREGERLELDYRNRTELTTNLHFHGLFVEPGGSGDNPWITVEPGESFRYGLNVGPGNAGLHWYHPHVHGRSGSSALAQMRGLVGPILVEHPGKDRLPAADDRILVLHDIAIEDGSVARGQLNDWAVGREGDLLLVNGVRYPKVSAQHAWLRLRLVNASNARYWHLSASDDGLLLQVAQDGTLLARPREIRDLLMPPGSRAELMVPLSGRAPFDLVNRPYSRVGSVYSGETPVLHIRPDRSFDEQRRLPDRLADWPEFDVSQVARRREIPIALLTICGRYFDSQRVDFPVQAGSCEVWTLRNVDLMDHPIHLHTWRFEPLRLNGTAMPYRARLDTFNLRPGDTLDIGISFERYTGNSLFHCHIVEHADKGMMAIVNVS